MAFPIPDRRKIISFSALAIGVVAINAWLQANHLSFAELLGIDNSYHPPSPSGHPGGAQTTEMVKTGPVGAWDNPYPDSQRIYDKHGPCPSPLSPNGYHMWVYRSIFFRTPHNSTLEDENALVCTLCGQYMAS